MISQVKRAAITLVAAVLALLSPTSALAYTSAPLTICNQVVFKLAVAYGYHSPGTNDPADHSLLTGPFVSQGWRTVEPGACATFDNPFGARYMFWFVAKMFGSGDPYDDAGVAAIRNAGVPDHFCVNNWMHSTGDTGAPVYSTPVNAFVYEDENVSADTCDKNVNLFAHNLWVIAHPVDTWVNATVNYMPQMVSSP